MNNDEKIPSPFVDDFAFSANVNAPVEMVKDLMTCLSSDKAKFVLYGNDIVTENGGSATRGGFFSKGIVPSKVIDGAINATKLTKEQVIDIVNKYFDEKRACLRNQNITE